MCTRSILMVSFVPLWMLILVTYIRPSKFLNTTPAIRACDFHVAFFPFPTSLLEYKAWAGNFQIPVQVAKEWSDSDILGQHLPLLFTVLVKNTSSLSNLSLDMKSTPLGRHKASFLVVRRESLSVLVRRQRTVRCQYKGGGHWNPSNSLKRGFGLPRGCKVINVS